MAHMAESDQCPLVQIRRGPRVTLWKHGGDTLALTSLSLVMEVGTLALTSLTLAMEVSPRVP